jgi:hypothetical protein
MKRLKLSTLLIFSFVLAAFAQEINLYSSAAAEASAVVKSSSGRIYMLVGHSTSGSDQWIQVHNTTSLPANGAVPVISFKATAGKNFSFSIPEPGIPLNTGIVVCNSSTQLTKTIGSADCSFYVLYR